MSKIKRVKLYTQQQVDLRETQIEELLIEVLEIERFLVTDWSELSHFVPNNAVEVYEAGPDSGLEIQDDPSGRNEFKTRVLKHYGFVLVDDHFDIPLWQLVDLLKAPKALA